MRNKYEIVFTTSYSEPPQSARGLTLSYYWSRLMKVLSWHQSLTPISAVVVIAREPSVCAVGREETCTLGLF